MNVALRQSMNLPRFLEWEARQTLRHEFDGCEPVAMAGGTVAHAAIQRNLALAVGGRLGNAPCQFFGSDLKIAVAGSVRYPDGFVVCSPVDPAATVVTDPAIVFEILSESTANTDLIVKNAEYRASPAIRRYVILEQTHAAAMVFSRHTDDWVCDLLAGTEAILELPEIGLSIPLTELYAGVFPPARPD